MHGLGRSPTKVLTSERGFLCIMLVGLLLGCWIAGRNLIGGLQNQGYGPVAAWLVFGVAFFVGAMGLFVLAVLLFNDRAWWWARILLLPLEIPAILLVGMYVGLGLLLFAALLYAIIVVGMALDKLMTLARLQKTMPAAGALLVAVGGMLLVWEFRQ